MKDISEAEEAKFALVNDETIEQMIDRKVHEAVEKQMALHGIQKQMYNLANRQYASPPEPRSDSNGNWTDYGRFNENS